jgi:hypothetical protein
LLTIIHERGCCRAERIRPFTRRKPVAEAFIYNIRQEISLCPELGDSLMHPSSLREVPSKYVDREYRAKTQLFLKRVGCVLEHSDWFLATAISSSVFYWNVHEPFGLLSGSGLRRIRMHFSTN